jgi:hypothetical protein
MPKQRQAAKAKLSSATSKALRLVKSVGLFAGEPTTSKDGKSLERDAMLVYDGQFESADGPVEISADNVEQLAANFNARVKLASGEASAKDLPPIQLDHSKSATVTVGRLIGPLKVEEREIDGKKVKALLGRVRILGAENVEKVVDGRWTHLSIGADLAKNEITELTITPFPAAAHASLLSAQGDNLNPKEKLKKRLMEQDKLSAEDADKKLASMSDEEADKELSQLEAADKEKADKLAAEETEKNKGELAAANKRVTELSAKGKKLAELVANVKKDGDQVRLAAAVSQINVRLARLRGQGLITPAEQKKIDVTKLAEQGDAVVEARLSGYEQREPVIPIGQFGSIKATNLVQMAKQKKLAELEARARKTMKSVPKQDGDVELEAGAPPPAQGAPADLSQASLAEVVGGLEQYLAAGDVEGVKKCLAALKAMSSSGQGQLPPEAEKQMSALQKQVVDLNGKIEQLVALSAELAS